MRQPMFVLLLFGVFAVSPAFAGTLVIGAGLGRECYEQTLSQPNPMRNIAALQICDKAVEDHSVNTYNRAAALVNRADILLRMGHFPEAISDSESAIALDPDIGAAHLNRGAGLIAGPRVIVVCRAHLRFEAGDVCPGSRKIRFELLGIE